MASLSLYACVHDDTVKTFRQLNEVTISGIEDTYDNVRIDKQLSIHPQLSTALGDESGLQFLWIAYDKNTYYAADTLSTERNLDIPVALAPGEHTLKFKVIDAATGVYYEKEFTVNVVNEFTKGLLILCDNQGKAELDFMQDGQTDIIRDVFGKVNEGMSLGQSPKRVYFNKFRKTEFNEVFVLCQDADGGCFLDGTTLKKGRDYKDFFMGVPDKILPQAYYKSSMRHYMINDGQAFDRATNTYSLTVKPAMSVSGKTYSIADNANFNDDEALPSRAVLYDNQNKCFYTLYSITSAFLTLASKTGGLDYISGGFFNPDNVGMTCLYGGLSSRSETEIREYMGVFQDDAGKRHLLKAAIAFWADVPEGQSDTFFKDLGDDVINSEAIDQAVTFACSPKFTGYMFYAAGTKLYIYNAENKTGRSLYDLGGSAQINHIEFDYDSNKLLVAYVDSSKADAPAGFAELEVGTDGGLHISLLARHDGLGSKIVDFEHKY